jgi:hypothetical protein
MDPIKAKKTLDLLGEKTLAAIYTKNWTVWNNSWDEVVFRSEILTTPAGMTIAFERPDDTIGAFTEKLFLRRPNVGR